MCLELRLLRPTDCRIVGWVSVRAKNFIRGIAVAVGPHERAYIFPDDISGRRHFEDAAPLAFADQGVAAPQPLCPTDVRAEEGVARLTAIFPHRPARPWVKLDDA